MESRSRAGSPDQLIRDARAASFDAMADAMLLANDGRRYVDANPAACELLGVPFESLIGRRLDDVVGTGSASALDVEAAWSAFIETGSQGGEFPVVRADGTRRILEYRARANVVPGIHLSLLRDITERRQREHESVIQLESSLAFSERFVGIVGHDLRNPLNAILMAASLLDSNASDADRKVIRRLSASARRMTRMVDQLLDLTRGRLGTGITVDPNSIDLRTVVTDAIDELTIGHGERDVSCRLPDHPVVGKWDGDRLGQVVSNLIGNAIAHGDSDRPIDVSLVDEGERVALSVHNHGPMIPSDLLPDLFDPFRRGDEAPSSKSSGLGLGLYITREIVAAHGGETHAASNAIDGTTFTVVLPRPV